MPRLALSTRVIWGSSSTTKILGFSVILASSLKARAYDLRFQYDSTRPKEKLKKPLNVCRSPTARRRLSRLLIHNVHINGGRGPEKSLDRGQVKVLLPAVHGRASKNNLSDFVFPGESGDGLRDVLAFQLYNFCLQVFREPHIG